MAEESNSARMIAERIERLPRSWWLAKARIIVGTATFFDGFDSLALAVAMPALIPVWHLTQGQVEVVLGSGSIGLGIGAIFFGWLAERIGRLKVSIIAIGLFSATSLLCAFAWDVNSMIVLRVVQGICLGGEVPVAAVYISELAKARNRGFFVLIYESVYGVGLFGASLLGVWIVPSFGWQSIFVVGALPALLIVVMRRNLPESPRWLASQGRFEEADRALAEIERAIMAEGRILPPPAALALAASTERGTWTQLFHGLYLGRTAIAWSVCLSAGFLTEGVTRWLPSILTTVYHLDLRSSLVYSALSSSMSIFGGIGVALLIDWTGRRNWIVLSFLVCVACFLVLGATGSPGLTLVITLTSIGRFFSTSIVTMVYLYTPELYPTRLRATGNGAANMWLNIGKALSPMLVGLVLASSGIGAVFLMLGGAGLVAAAVFARFATETSRRVLEEVSP